VKDIEFSISTNAESFGSPAAKASLAKTKEPQKIDCPETTGRYVLLRALSEQSGGDLASVAELGVIGN